MVGILSDNLNVAFCSHSVQIIYARLDNSIPLTLQQFVATFVKFAHFYLLQIPSITLCHCMIGYKSIPNSFVVNIGLKA